MVTWTEQSTVAAAAPPTASAPPPAPPPAAAVALELCGFDAENGAFLLSAGSAAAAAIGAKRTRPESYLRREFVDFQSWDRQLGRAHKQQQQQLHEHEQASKTQFERLPARRVRKLMEQSWLKNDASAGWRLELQKTVAASEKWINGAFRLLPTDQQHAFLNNQQYQQYKQERADARADAQHAKELQQYFTSQPLVDLTLERVAAVLRSKSAGEDTEQVFPSDRTLWLEPSCGDGRFVTSLLDAGARHVVGIELDDALCREARAAVREYVPERVEIRQSDFLVSQRGYGGGAGGVEQVVAIGNPPFGDKAGASLSTDLVQRFFEHTAREWRAGLIAFIVPERCARPTYTEATLATLRAASSAGDGEWQLVVSEPLDGFYFEFRSTKRIKQPSTLVIYHRLSSHAASG